MHSNLKLILFLLHTLLFASHNITRQNDGFLQNVIQRDHGHTGSKKRHRELLLISSSLVLPLLKKVFQWSCIEELKISKGHFEKQLCSPWAAGPIALYSSSPLALHGYVLGTPDSHPARKLCHLSACWCSEQTASQSWKHRNTGITAEQVGVQSRLQAQQYSCTEYFQQWSHSPSRAGWGLQSSV